MKCSVKRTGALILAALLVLLSSACTSKQQEDYDPERFVMITLHAGEDGYFDKKGITEYKTLQFRGDEFIERKEPTPVSENKLFVGWATTPDAEEPNVYVLVTNVNDIGTDVYAVWTDTTYMEYRAVDGYFQIDGVEYGSVLMKYTLGDTFRPGTVYSYTEQLKFGGWYTEMNGNGREMTETSVINWLDPVIYANWVYNDEKIEDLEMERAYAVSVKGGGFLFRFTPSETDLYEIYTSNNSDPDDTQAYIRMLDANRRSLGESNLLNWEGDSYLAAELEAGKTYYFQIRELYGLETSFSFCLHKPEGSYVTFHANKDGSAYFDGDPAKTEKTIKMKNGILLGLTKYTGLELSRDYHGSWIGWSTNPDDDYLEIGLVLENDIDVYGIYEDFNYITLDANGGYFPLDAGSAVKTQNYASGQIFKDVDEPRIDDVRVKFAGWATTKDAKEPDIPEAELFFSNLPDTIYAVYTEKILVTFDANGGYFLSNPDKHIYSSTRGIGHIFFGMNAMHEDPRMTPMAWEDQDGNLFPYTDDVATAYHYTGDTYWKAVWGREITIDANGGYYYDDPEITALNIPYLVEEKFNTMTIEYLAELPRIDKEGMVLAGWATTPDAIEPDVIENVTPISELSEIYAVWRPAD